MHGLFIFCLVEVVSFLDFQFGKAFENRASNQGLNSLEFVAFK